LTPPSAAAPYDRFWPEAVECTKLGGHHWAKLFDHCRWVGVANRLAVLVTDVPSDGIAWHTFPGTFVGSNYLPRTFGPNGQ